MKAEFDVNMKTSYMYDFLLNHMYRRFQGIFSVILGVLAFGLCIYTLGKVEVTFTIAYGFFGLLFVLYMPFTLYTRAKRQVLLTPMFKKPLHYLVDQKGIRTTQGQEAVFTPWEKVIRVSQTRKSVVVYMSKVNAFVWPKECVGQELEHLLALLKEHAGTGKVKR